MLLLMRAQMHNQYSRYRLGYLWSLLGPLSTIIFLSVIFTLLLGKQRGLGYQPFMLFVATGILPWAWVTGTVGGAMGMSRKYSNRMTATLLPRRIWPLSGVLTGFIQFFMVSPLYVLFCIVTLTAPSPWIIIAMPIAMVLQFFLLYGIALIIMPLVALSPDLRNLIQIIMRLLFYVSPILYSVSRVPEQLQPFTIINPLTGILDLYRVGFWPEAVMPWYAYVITAGICLGVLGFGLVFYKKMEMRMLRAIV